MSIGVLSSSGVISYLSKTDTPVAYFTTTETDQIINFFDTEEGDVQRSLNALLIENAGETAIYVRPIPYNYLIYIPGGEGRNIDSVKCTGIQIMGESGKLIRWSGCFY